MAERTIGAERLFYLGNYKNIRLQESITFDDTDYTDEDLDVIRYLNIVNLYMGFAVHQNFLEAVKGTAFDPDEIIRMVVSERRNVEETVSDINLMEEQQDG